MAARLGGVEAARCVVGGWAVDPFVVDALALAHPDHPWIARLGGTTG